MQKECPTCRNLFQARGNKKFCSKKCKDNFKFKESNFWDKGGEVIYCRNCGKCFHFPNVKICGDCGSHI